jgi:hypothetical protein
MNEETGKDRGEAFQSQKDFQHDHFLAAIHAPAQFHAQG